MSREGMNAPYVATGSRFAASPADPPSGLARTSRFAVRWLACGPTIARPQKRNRRPAGWGPAERRFDGPEWAGGDLRSELRGRAR